MLNGISFYCALLEANTSIMSEGTGQQQVMGDESGGDERGHILNRESGT